MQTNVQKDKDDAEVVIPNTPGAFFLFVIRPFKWWAIGAVSVVVVASVLSQSSSYFFKLIIDAIEVDDYDSALKYALLYPVMIFIIQLLYRGAGFLGGNLVTKVKKNGYDTLSSYVMKHSHSYFSDRFAGSVLSKITNVNSAVDTLIPEILWTFTTTFFSLLVTAGFLFTIDTTSALIFTSLIFVLFLVNKYLAPKKTIYAKDYAEAQTNLRARLVDNISSVQAVRQYVRTSYEDKEISKLSSRLENSNRKTWMYSEWMLLWNSLILFAFSFTMFWFLIEGWKVSDVSTGELVLVLSLYSQITGMLIFIGRAFNSTARTVGEMDEGLKDLLLPYEIKDDQYAVPLDSKQAQICCSGVDFSFDDKSVFSDFNLYIPAGQRLGLVGKSGAGKTTLVSLLLRQHELLKGLISIDGQNISEITQDSLRHAIAVVPQEPALFHRTVRDNILYGNPQATHEEVVEVSKKAQAHDFIMELSNGYDTMVGERGVKLSGGQKQRVAIARAMLKDAPILILDEATSALDSESEVAIQKALESLMEGRTVIAIAHRLSTLRKMDRIIVLEKGKIIEEGSHDFLATSGGVYERLWNHQAGGFLLEK